MPLNAYEYAFMYIHIYESVKTHLKRQYTRCLKLLSDGLLDLEVIGVLLGFF